MLYIYWVIDMNMYPCKTPWHWSNHVRKDCSLLAGKTSIYKSTSRKDGWFRPGRKQATVTKLGIYSPYSPRSSIHFLARCCNFCKPLKKNSELVRPIRSLWQQWPPCWMKMATFQLVFRSKEQMVVWWGQIQRIGWVIKTLEAQVGQFLLGFKCPVSRDIVVQEQDPLGDLPAALAFSFKMSFSCTSRDEL